MAAIKLNDLKLRISVKYVTVYISRFWKNSITEQSEYIHLSDDIVNFIDITKHKINQYEYELLSISIQNCNKLLDVVKKRITRHSFLIKSIELTVSDKTFKNDFIVFGAIKSNSKVIDSLLNKHLATNIYNFSSEEIIQWFNLNKPVEISESLSFTQPANINSEVEKFSLSKDYVGFLGIAPHLFIKGKELELDIKFADGRVVKDYIFIHPMSSLKRMDNFHIYEYFIYNHNVMLIIKEQLKLKKLKYISATTISIVPRLYDEGQVDSVFEYHEKKKPDYNRIYAPGEITKISVRDAVRRLAYVTETEELTVDLTKDERGVNRGNWKKVDCSVGYKRDDYDAKWERMHEEDKHSKMEWFLSQDESRRDWYRNR